jgi:hypothetical protein
MPRLRKQVLCYFLRREKGHGYEHDVLRTFYAREQDLQLLAAGTIGNRAGYGTPDAADRMGRWYMSLIELGHRITLDSISRWDSPAPQVTIDWQVYKPDFRSLPGSQPGYCEPRFREIGDDSYNDIQKGAKFLRRIGSRIEKIRAKKRDEPASKPSNHSFKDPVIVIEALEAMGARRVELIRGTGEHHYTNAWVYDDSPRPWMMTDTLWRTFETDL